MVPVGICAHHRPAPDPARRPPAGRRSASTGPASSRWPSPSPACSSCCRAASGSTGSNSAEIVIETSSPSLAFYVFLAHSLTRRGAVPEPEAAARPQLCDRPGAGDDLRHAELHADGAAAAAAAAACRLSRCADRRDHRRRGVGATIGFFLRVFIGRMDPRIGMIVRLRPAGHIRALADGASTSTSTWTRWC